MENRAYTDEEMQEAQELVDQLTAERDALREKLEQFEENSRTTKNLWFDVTQERDALQAENEWLSTTHGVLKTENERLRGQLGRLIEAINTNISPPVDAPFILRKIAAQIQQENSDEDHD